MKDIMETRARRQLKAVCDVVDDGGNPVWPEEPRTQLALGGTLKGSGRTVTEPQPHPVTHSETELAVMFVVDASVDVLGLLKPGASISQHLLALGHGFSHSCHPCLARLIGANGWWLTAVDDGERRSLECCLECSVEDVLCSGQPA